MEGLPKEVCQCPVRTLWRAKESPRRSAFSRQRHCMKSGFCALHIWCLDFFQDLVVAINSHERKVNVFDSLEAC